MGLEAGKHTEARCCHFMNLHRQGIDTHECRQVTTHSNWMIEIAAQTKIIVFFLRMRKRVRQLLTPWYIALDTSRPTPGLAHANIMLNTSGGRMGTKA
jgi:hypothetical protein